MKTIIHSYILPVLLLSISSLVFAQDNLPKPVFKNGEAQLVAAFSSPDHWIKEELWVQTDFDSDNDGKMDRMHVYVTRPDQTDSQDLKLPIIYSSSPYYGLKLFAMMGLGSKKMNWNVKHELGETPKRHRHGNRGIRTKRPLFSGFSERPWLSRGYIRVYSSSPGTGLSDGAPTIGGENESLAPKAVIDWLCGRAKGYTTRTGNEEVAAYWSSGKVGMTGTSYDGTLCIAAATTGVEGLEAIIPIAPVTSFYHYYRSNGLVRSPGGYVGEDADVLYDFINCGDKKMRKHNDTAIRDNILAKNIDRETGDYNEFWDSRDYLNRLENMKAAMLMSHGLNDWNVMTEQSYRFYKAAEARGLSTQLYYHQNGHGGDPPMKMMNRWFTHYLHGIENGVENDPQVQIVREHTYSPTSYTSFPDVAASDVVLYPVSSSNAVEGRIGQLTLLKQESEQKETIIDNYKIKSTNKLLDSKNAQHRLLFVSPTLNQDVRLSGVVKVSVSLACNKPAANLSVYLVSLPWDEEKGVQVYDNIITRGWADPQNHSSEKGEPLELEKFYQVTFDLMPDDQVVRRGQQIGLVIFSSDKDFTLWSKPGTELTFDLNATSITLPIVGGSETFERATR